MKEQMVTLPIQQYNDLSKMANIGMGKARIELECRGLVFLADVIKALNATGKSILSFMTDTVILDFEDGYGNRIQSSFTIDMFKEYKYNVTKFIGEVI